MEDTFEIRTDEVMTSSVNGDLIEPEEAREIHGWVTPDEGQDPVTVAVMDSGIHEDAVKNNPWFEGTEVTKTFDATRASEQGADEVGHGTAVASIVARNSANVELYDVRIFREEGTTRGRSIQRAYGWLIEHAEEIDIINMSWGSRDDVAAINRIHRRLMENDVHNVIAAGNTGSDGGSPATTESAFSVGALTKFEKPARFSSFDPDKGNPDVAAVGKDVKAARAPGTSMGTPLGGRFTKASGTSFAAPYVSAAYADMLLRKRQSWDEDFMNDAKDIKGTKRDGAGAIRISNMID